MSYVGEWLHITCVGILTVVSGPAGAVLLAAAIDGSLKSSLCPKRAFDTEC